jgi:hypothetical protein
MGHADQPDILLEVLGNELGAVVRNDSGAGLREFLPGALQDDFYIFFGHRFT